jgi:hypothetical protein
MKPGDENVKVEPCPFCGLSLERHERRGFPIYEHPVVDDDYSCPLVTYKLVVGASKSDQEIAAWNRRTPPSLAGGVAKPLTWAEHYEGSDFRGGSTDLARSILGTYQVWGDGFWSNFHMQIDGLAGNIDEAKAAAQADYNARILSALTPSPVPTTIPAETLEEAIEESIIGGTDDFPAINRALLLGNLRALPEEGNRGWQDASKVIPALLRDDEADRRPNYVLVFNGYHVGTGYRQVPNYEGDPEWCDETGAFIEPPVTHWMPLPAAPARTGRE